MTAATSLGVFSYLVASYGLDAKVRLEDGPQIRRLQQIEIATGIAFLALNALGVVDAVHHHQRLVPQCRSTLTRR